MMIVCYTVGLSSGVSALLFYKQEDGAQFHRYSWVVLCSCFGHYASMDVYFYRVWHFCYKCKLQNEFEKVRSDPAARSQKLSRSSIVHLMSSSSLKFRTSTENERKENLLKKTKPKSVHKSKFVRYRHILGRSMLNKVFWIILWVSECIVVFSCFRSRRDNKKISWYTGELSNEFFTSVTQIICFVVLFIQKYDDLFRIKIELRLIFFISTT